MDHLLDTNVLIFFLEGSSRLKTKLAELIESPRTISYISTASLWEISLKVSLGKLQTSYATYPDLPKILQNQGFEILEIN